MSQMTRRGTHLQVGLLAGLGALLVQVSSASATPPVSMFLAPGGEYKGENQPGEPTENEGPGNEQAVSTVVERDGRTYVLTVYMSSVVDQDKAPWQCKCSSVELDPVLGPQMVADQVYLTDNDNTDRACNRPVVISDKDNILFAYGYAPNNNQTKTYVRGIDHMCNSVTETKKVSDNDNDNIGAPDIVKTATPGRYQVAFYNNNHGRTSVRDITITNGVIENVALNTVVEPSNIGRPSMASDGMYTLVCAAKGDQRPPEDGVACAYLDNTTGQAMWTNEVVAESQPGNHIYMNQPTVTLLSPGRFVVGVVESTGAGKNTGDKGGSKTHMYMLEPTLNGPNVRSTSSGQGLQAVHGAVVSGMYGEKGEAMIGLFEAPITGSGPPTIRFFGYDSTAAKFGTIDKIKNEWVVGATNADSGYLNNIYGGNPTDQGREFLRATPNVANPGALVEGGWMNEVETFFVMPYAGMTLQTDTKNSLFLSFVPGKTKVPVTPEGPQALDPADVGSPTPDAPPPPPPADDPTVEAPPVAEPAGPIPGTTPTNMAGGCSINEGSSSGNMAGLLALGLALVGISRRRRAN